MSIQDRQMYRDSKYTIYRSISLKYAHQHFFSYCINKTFTFVFFLLQTYINACPFEYFAEVYFSHGFLKLYFWPLSSTDLRNLLCFLCGYKPKARQSESAYSKTLIWDYEPFINLSSVILWEPRSRIQWIFHTFISYAISGAQKWVLLGIILCGLFLCVSVCLTICVFGELVCGTLFDPNIEMCILYYACAFIFGFCTANVFLCSPTAFKEH